MFKFLNMFENNIYEKILYNRILFNLKGSLSPCSKQQLDVFEYGSPHQYQSQSVKAIIIKLNYSPLIHASNIPIRNVVIKILPRVFQGSKYSFTYIQALKVNIHEYPKENIKVC